MTCFFVFQRYLTDFSGYFKDMTCFGNRLKNDAAHCDDHCWAHSHGRSKPASPIDPEGHRFERPEHVTLGYGDLNVWLNTC